MEIFLFYLFIPSFLLNFYFLPQKIISEKRDSVWVDCEVTSLYILHSFMNKKFYNDIKHILNVRWMKVLSKCQSDQTEDLLI